MGITPGDLKPVDGVRLLAMQLRTRSRSGANWFYWIAGLSLLNSLSGLIGSRFQFVIGLGITQFADGLVKGSGANPGLGLAFDLFAAGMFAMFGYLCSQRMTRAFYVGMILYLLDGLLFLLFKDVISIGFHLYALFWIFRGMKANEELLKLEAAGSPA